jgi:serine/threonine-protein kinase
MTNDSPPREDTPQLPPAPSDPGDLITGRYRLLARLGKGGAGVVFKAADTQQADRPVAMKILAPKDFKDPTARQRFEKEVMLTREFKHRNLVEVYDFGTTETGQLYLTMEFVDGGTLGKRIYDADQRLSFNETLFYLRDVASGVGFAHAHGVVHRDLKPDNILLTSSRAAKVADFGLARQMEAGHTITHSADTVGTPYYMAPEQFQRHRVDGRADIYALGIIAYEMVNRERPFVSETYQLLAMAHMKHPMPTFYEKGGEVPKWFETFVLICTEKNPAARFQTMEEVVSFLEKKMIKMRLLEGEVEKEPLVMRVLSRLLGEE